MPNEVAMLIVVVYGFGRILNPPLRLIHGLICNPEFERAYRFLDSSRNDDGRILNPPLQCQTKFATLNEVANINCGQCAKAHVKYRRHVNRMPPILWIMLD